jgi:pilus assembly protein FimV
LTAPDEAEAAASTAGEGADLDAMRRELVLATEAAEVQRRQSEEMETRLQVLEEQIAKMQRLIELKDDQLALLSSQAGVDAPADAGEPGDAADEPRGVDALEAELFAGEGAELDEPPAMPGDPARIAPDAEQAPEGAPSPAMTSTPREAAPVPEPFEESRSLLDLILANPLWLGAGAVVLAMLALLGLRRRSVAEPEFQESILQEREVRPTRASAPVVKEAAQAQPEAESRPRDSDSSLLSEFATSDLGAIQNQSEADPLAEADVYLAYGRYQQAEDLIRDALESEPGREDFSLKLFEIYAAAQNRSGFDAHAENVLASLESQDHPLWRKVVEMGRELNPQNPLYQSSAAQAPELGDDRDRVAEADNGLDFDMDLGDASADLTSQEPPLTDMDFDLGTGEDEQSPPEPAETESGDLDFDLGDLDLGGAGENEPEEEGEGLLSNLDEVATKLDLARAYIDMGDPDGARSILEEVLEEGNEPQQEEARDLLGQL